MSDPLVIEADADGRVSREHRSPLAGRRIMAAAIIAVAEVVAIIAWRPSLLLVVLVASVVTVLAAWASFKLAKHGLLRDVLWVIALSQAMVVAIPLVLGVSLIAALIVAVVLLIGIVVLITRSRF
ncbi:MAG: hypothetical protein OEM67_11495 [Thermoleophilia bacterium]|nr:hypothetical protein [Thermoleophilia bacterium]MDH3724197.1 hypothetical protein [Thermoleophilia bacterium]